MRIHERYVARSFADPTVETELVCRQCNGWGHVYVQALGGPDAATCGFCGGTGQVLAELAAALDEAVRDLVDEEAATCR